MTADEIKKSIINNDALFNNIYLIEQEFDIIPNSHPHYGASIAFQDIQELRKDFLYQLVDTVVDWVYSSEKYTDLQKSIWLQENLSLLLRLRLLEKLQVNLELAVISF